jgi:hypothetical protein
MIDVELETPLVVRTAGRAGPYLLVPIQQLAEVEAVLRAEDVQFSTSRDAVQVDGHNAIAMLEFGRKADAAHVQGVLDRH